MTQNEASKRFKCEQCFYQTDRKYDLKRHCINKHYVEFILNIENISNGKNVHPNEKNVPPNGKNVPPNEKIVPPNEKIVPLNQKNDIITNQNNTNNYICNKCDKKYKNYKSYLLHEKICKGINELTCTKCMTSFTSRQHKSRHVLKNNCKSRSIIYSETYRSKNNIDNLNTNNITTNGNIEYQYNCRDVNSNNINNFYINNYKNERLDYVDYEKLLDIFTKTYDIPRLLTKEIHFNKEFPENNNITYENKENAIIKINNEYILKDLNLLAEELVNEKTTQMQKFAEENKEDICLKIEHKKYYEMIELLLNFILLKEPEQHYKIQIKNIKDLIKNNKD
jgi:hypothetical protein